MVLPKPVVIVGLFGAYVVGNMITWYEWCRSRERWNRTATVSDKTLINERLA